MKNQSLAVEPTSRDEATYASHCFSVDAYYRMLDAGILDEDDRIELIDGRLLVKEPASPAHSGHSSLLTNLLIQEIGNRAIVREQHPVHLDDFNEPEPDVAVLKQRDDFYTGAHPRTEDIILLVEVALTSLAADKQMKAPLYARAGIRELWIVNLPEGQAEVYREPSESGYRRITRLGPGTTLRIGAFPDVEILVSDVIRSST